MRPFPSVFRSKLLGEETSLALLDLILSKSSCKEITWFSRIFTFPGVWADRMVGVQTVAVNAGAVCLDP